MDPTPSRPDPGATADHQGGEPSDRAYSVFDDLTDVVVVLDANFDIAYANEFALSLLGYERATIVGRSVTEFLNAEDIVRAFEVVALMSDNQVGVPITPALYDLRRSDGTWLPVELNAVTPPAGTPAGHTLVIGRYSGDHDLQNRILELITADSRDADLVALIPGFGSWRHPDEQYAVLYSDVEGADQVVGTPEVVSLITDHPGGDAPWARARREDREILFGSVDMLPAPLRADAEAVGLGACWVVPVADHLHDSPAVLIGWSRTQGPPASVHRYALEIMGRMLTLVLQWRRQREALERAARRDPLTGVVNRAGFFEVLGARLEGAETDAMIGLLYIDLDGFKDVNDLHGHSVGDDVLAEVAERLSSAVRGDDLIGRLGGDEFAVLCPAVVDLDDLTTVARRIIEVVSQPITVRGIELRVGASIGIATTIGTVVPDQLVDAADRSLYLAKAAGRGRWHLADLEPGGRTPPAPPLDPLRIDWDRRSGDTPARSRPLTDPES
jgi:diguanylate cyclase (GGDEF)-like protein/PAS domain S-box-containing protein